jgi:hypothetical protein
MAKGRWITHNGRHIFLAEGDAAFVEGFDKNAKDNAARKKKFDAEKNTAAKNDAFYKSRPDLQRRNVGSEEDKTVAAARKAAGLAPKHEMSGTGAQGKKWKFSRPGFDEAVGGFVKSNKRDAAWKDFMKFNSKELSANAHFEAWLHQANKFVS